MNCQLRRARLRDILAGSQCVTPASVYDPISARLAQDLGFEAAMLAGSVASFSVLGAPDLVVLTLPELAEQVHRICRASTIPLIVDADHGFGNALSVRRTIEELETAGVSGITIEDTLLPAPYAGSGKGLIAQDEAVGKFHAALDARQDDALTIFGRTTAFASVSVDEAVDRVGAYADTGVDAIFLVGITDWAQVEAARRATRLPIVLGGTGPAMKDPARLASLGVAIALPGHEAFSASVYAAYQSMKALRTGAPAEPFDAKRAGELLDKMTRRDEYREWTRRYLGGS